MFGVIVNLLETGSYVINDGRVEVSVFEISSSLVNARFWHCYVLAKSIVYVLSLTLNDVTPV